MSPCLYNSSVCPRASLLAIVNVYQVLAASVLVSMVGSRKAAPLLEPSLYCTHSAPLTTATVPTVCEMYQVLVSIDRPGKASVSVTVGWGYLQLDTAEEIGKDC